MKFLTQLLYYAAGNEANGKFTNKGDYIYTTTAQINIVAPTPTECETESMSASPSTVELNREESVQVVVTLIPADGCLPEEGGIVKAKVNKTGKKRITVSPQSATTNANGEATFTITAKNKGGQCKGSIQISRRFKNDRNGKGCKITMLMFT